MTHVLRYAARTDRGLLRANNQDSVFAGGRLLVIADGMGGHAAGDVASRLVVAAFVDLDELPLGSDMVLPLTDATRAGNNAIAEMVDENPEFDGMGTTLTALLFDGPVVALAHVGDSRAYLYRNGVLHQISHDDTFVQSLVDDGRITADEAAHHPQRSLLLRALNGTEMDPSITLRETSPGDRFLICSDGLSDVVSPESIADALAGPDPEQVADTLIQLALVGGGPDNVTVIVADVIETGETAPFGIAGGMDPEATGPMQPIHLTREMPRVPLPPIPEDVPARPEYASVDEGPELHDDDDDKYEDDDDDATGYESGPDISPGFAGQQSATAAGRRMVSAPAGRRWHRRWAFGLALVVLVGVGLSGSYLWASTKYYVGQNDSQVAVFRGVNGSLLGWKFASVQENSCATSISGCTPLKVGDLVQAARDQVTAGIPVSTLADARAVMTRLNSEQLPPCPVAAITPATTTSGSTPPDSSLPATGATASPPITTGPVKTTGATPSRAAPPATIPPRTTAARSTPARTTTKSTAARSAAARTLAAKTTSAAAPRPGPGGSTGRSTSVVAKSPAAVTTTVTITVNPLAAQLSGAAAGQRLRDAGIRALRAPTTSGPVTRADVPGATPTVTFFTTVTSRPTTSAATTSSGTPLISPAAQPGITCRPVP